MKVVTSFLLLQLLLSPVAPESEWIEEAQILETDLVDQSDLVHGYGRNSKDPCLGLEQQIGDKVCVVRGLEYSAETMYQHVSGCYCYWYMNPTLYRDDVDIKMVRCGTAGVFEYPCILLPNMTVLPYNYTNDRTVQVLGNTLVSAAATDKWIQCAKSAVSCCDNMKQEDVNPDEGHCSANWDGWSCWDKSPIETTQHEPCPDFAYSGELPSCQQYSDKDCLATGKWNETTRYGLCSTNPITMMRDRNSYHVIALYISIATSLPALIIFFSYRKLSVTRVILHRNLILFIILHNIMTIVVKTVITQDALSDKAKEDKVMMINSEWCRVLSFAEKLSGSAVFSCMMMESIFLHRLIAAAFKGEPKMIYYYLLAIGIAVVPVCVWAAVTAVYNDAHCWTSDTSSYVYIVDGPRIFTLVLNALLMIDIVRVLATKLRQVNTAKSGQIRRMTRATILLMPLFGVQFLLTLARPNTKDCALEQAYYYIFYTMDALQSTLVALLYCYLNKEVKVQLLRTYQLLMARLLGDNYVAKPRPTWSYSEARHTTTSLVMPDDILRSSVSFPNSPTSPDVKEGRARTSVSFAGPSLVVGNVSEILSQKEGPQSPGPRAPRSSMTFPRSSLKNTPNSSSHPRLRKVSAVSEELSSGDSTEEPKSEVPKSNPGKAHDSDEDTTPDLVASQDSSAHLKDVTAPLGVNLGFSISSENINEQRNVRRRSSTSSLPGDETNA